MSNVCTISTTITDSTNGKKFKINGDDYNSNKTIISLVSLLLLLLLLLLLSFFSKNTKQDKNFLLEYTVGCQQLLGEMQMQTWKN